MAYAVIVAAVKRFEQCAAFTKRVESYKAFGHRRIQYGYMNLPRMDSEGLLELSAEAIDLLFIGVSGAFRHRQERQ